MPLVVLLNLGCFFLLANLYYLQPITTDVAAAFKLPAEQAGSMVAVVQAGYVAGIALAVPLGDRFSPKALITALVGMNALTLACAAMSLSYSFFLVSIFAVGFTSAAMQLIVPLALRITPSTRRGRMIGVIAASGYLGIAAARALGSASVAFFSWRSLLFAAAVVMALITVFFSRYLPQEKAQANHTPLIRLFLSSAVMPLSVRGLPSAMLASAAVFCCYTFFWSTVPLALRAMGHTPGEVSLFSLASLITPVAAVAAGRWMDKGASTSLVMTGAIAGIGAFVLGGLLPGFAVLVLCVFLMDPGFSFTTSAVQKRAISSVPQATNRINAAVVSCNFLGSTAGAFLGPWIYAREAWAGSATAGLAIGCVALLFALMTAAVGGRRRHSKD